MIDIHSHILPGVDDGSPSEEVSLNMIWQASQCGTTVIVMTPHCNIPGMYENYNEGTWLTDQMDALTSLVKEEGIPIKLMRGMEVFGTSDSAALLRDGKFLTLNNTKNLLIEFAFQEDPEHVTGILEDVIREGYTPVVAHPERYVYVQRNPMLVDRWIRMGCVTQVNKGSILGRFGHDVRECVWYLLQNGMAAAVASDAHHDQWRTTMLDEVEHVLRRSFDEEYASFLLKDNPERILKGREVLWPL